MRGMRGGGFRGYGHPLVRPGRIWRRPILGWWPFFWGAGFLLFPGLFVLGWFLLALLRVTAR
jgi:hypothetical protein